MLLDQIDLLFPGHLLQGLFQVRDKDLGLHQHVRKTIFTDPGRAFLDDPLDHAPRTGQNAVVDQFVVLHQGRTLHQGAHGFFHALRLGVSPQVLHHQSLVALVGIGLGVCQALPP